MPRLPHIFWDPVWNRMLSQGGPSIFSLPNHPLSIIFHLVSSSTLHSDVYVLTNPCLLASGWAWPMGDPWWMIPRNDYVIGGIYMTSFFPSRLPWAAHFLPLNVRALLQVVFCFHIPGLLPLLTTSGLRRLHLSWVQRYCIFPCGLVILLE